MSGKKWQIGCCLSLKTSQEHHLAKTTTENAPCAQWRGFLFHFLPRSWVICPRKGKCGNRERCQGDWKGVQETNMKEKKKCKRGRKWEKREGREGKGKKNRRKRCEEMKRNLCMCQRTMSEHGHVTPDSRDYNAKWHPDQIWPEFTVTSERFSTKEALLGVTRDIRPGIFESKKALLTEISEPSP